MNRIIPGILLAVLWLVLLLKAPSNVFFLVVIVIAFLAADEYLRMAKSEVLRNRERIALNLVILFPVFSVLIFSSQQHLGTSLLLSFFCLTGYFFYRYAKFKESYEFFSRLLFGVIYIGVLISYFPLLMSLPDGAAWLVITSAITACSDSGAYFVGCSIGKNKLCPNISPKKTIEGALGGLFFAIIAAFASAYLLLPDINPWFLGFVAIILAIAGVAGDLVESVIKRGTNVKDSGTILAGHGGILDRVDSLLFTVPILYTILVAVA
ncbi:MAG: phosphatidate cytidylyltransferase [Desulfotalea sp.]